MRNYLYLWHDPEKRFLVTSGIEFKDIASRIGTDGGLLLLEHDYAEAVLDRSSRFEYIPSSQIEKLKNENIYKWGDIRWVDYSGDSFPMLSKQDMAELLYFRHTGEPFEHVRLPVLKNKFFACGHDDGWFLQLYYESWFDVIDLIDGLGFLRNIDIRTKVLSGDAGAFWIDDAGIKTEVATFDIDSILNRKRKKPTGQNQ